MYVLIGHSSYLSIHTGIGGVTYTLPKETSAVYYSLPFLAVRRMAGWVYSFHMPLFFMLSGAVFALKPAGKISSVIKSKTKRLLIPYFVYGWGFMFPVKFAGNFYNANTIAEAMMRFIYGGEAGHLWFLPALFWCFLIFSVMHSFFAGNNMKCLIFSGVISLLCVYVPGRDIFLGLKQGMNNIVWFSAGYVFETERKRFQSWNNKIILAVMAVFSILEIMNIIQYPYFLLKRGTAMHKFVSVILCSSLTYMLSVLCSRFFSKASDSKIWDVIVRNSFYVYIFHDPLEYIALRIFMNGGFLTSGCGCIAYFLSRTAITFIISILLGETVRRIKCHLNFS